MVSLTKLHLQQTATKVAPPALIKTSAKETEALPYRLGALAALNAVNKAGVYMSHAEKLGDVFPGTRDGKGPALMGTALGNVIAAHDDSAMQQKEEALTMRYGRFEPLLSYSFSSTVLELGTGRGDWRNKPDLANATVSIPVWDVDGARTTARQKPLIELLPGIENDSRMVALKRIGEFELSFRDGAQAELGTAGYSTGMFYSNHPLRDAHESRMIGIGFHSEDYIPQLEQERAAAA